MARARSQTEDRVHAALLVALAAIVLVPGASALKYVATGQGFEEVVSGTGEHDATVPTPVGDVTARVEDDGLNGLLTGGPPDAELCVGSGCPTDRAKTQDAPGVVETASMTPPETSSTWSLGSAASTDRVAATDGVSSQGDRVPGERARGPTFARPLWAALAAGAAAAIVLYRRLTGDDILDHDVRASIVETVDDEPGIHIAALADRLDVAQTTALYHVRLLEEFGKLTLDRSGRETCCYRPEHGPAIRSLRSALRSEAKRELVDLVLEAPGLNMSEAARRLGKDRSTVKYHVDDLLDDGVLASRRDGASKTLQVPDRVRDALDDPDPG